LIPNQTEGLGFGELYAEGLPRAANQEGGACENEQGEHKNAERALGHAAVKLLSYENANKKHGDEGDYGFKSAGVVAAGDDVSGHYYSVKNKPENREGGAEDALNDLLI